MTQKECLHQGQVTFEEGTREIICSDCLKKLVWVKPRQLTGLVDRLIEISEKYEKLANIYYKGTA